MLKWFGKRAPARAAHEDLREDGQRPVEQAGDFPGLFHGAAPGTHSTATSVAPPKERSLAGIFIDAAWRVFSSEASLGCAGVAFFGFLSLFPAIAAAVIVFGILLDDAIIGGILDMAGPLMPDGPEAILRDRLDALSRQPVQGLGVGLAVSLAFAFWAGSRGVNALVFALTRAYRGEDERGILAGLVVSILLTAGGFGVMVLALFAIAILPAAANLPGLAMLEGSGVLLLRWPVIGLIVFLGTIALYAIAPYRPLTREVRLVPGALVASLLWLGASWLFSAYVENFANYDATFGSLAAVAILLLWFYYSAVIFLYGAMVNSDLEMAASRKRARGPATHYP